MRRLGTFRTTLAILGLAFACGGQVAPVQGAFIATQTSSVTRLDALTYSYSYTVSVAATSTVSASGFDLSLGGAIDPDSIVAPSEFFAFYTLGDPSISFTAFENGTPFLGINPGSSGTFSFTSTLGPVVGNYQIQGLDPSFTLATVVGPALVPGSVPEPASLLLTTLGLAGFLGASIRARRRASVG